MDQRNSKLTVLESFGLAAMGLSGLVLFALLFPRVDPASQLGLQVDRGDALAISEEHLRSFGVRVDSYQSRNSRLVVDDAQRAFFSTTDADIAAMADEHRASAIWQVLFLRDSDRDRFSLAVDPRGNVVACERTPGATASPGSVDRAEAGRVAQEFLRKSGYDPASMELVDAQSTQLAARTDHAFSWRIDADSASALERRVRTTVIGDRVESWAREVVTPAAAKDRYRRRSEISTLFQIGSILLIISTVVLALIVFVFRFRSYEVGIRNGVVVAIVTVVLFLSYNFNTMSWVRHDAIESTGLVTWAAIYVNLGLVAFLTGLGMALVWISGESLARETWPSKLKSLDGLFAKRYLFPDLGRGIGVGFTAGFVVLGLWSLLSFIAIEALDVHPVVTDDTQRVLSAYLPVGIASVVGSYTGLLVVAYGFLFMVTFLRGVVKNTALAVLIAAVLFGPLFGQTILLYDRWLTAVISVVCGLITFGFFLRYDLATVLVSQIVVGAAPISVMFLLQPHAHYQAAGSMGLIVLGLALCYGYFAAARGRPLDHASILPTYARFISERERLKMELDIARRAQLRMLPRKVPTSKGLDIAAYSEPAREVGGDYYDFFHLDERRLGIAVGDVSGKGMPAALYMTMLKGFLQSEAKPQCSPRAILSNVNRYFHASADSNVFVTLLLVIIDLETSTLTFARAGHYPLIVYRPSSRSTFVMQPPGIGIGLESGPVFDRVIQDERFDLEPGDIIALFTDGVTEARGGRGSDEFGQQRLAKLLRAGIDATAEDILTGIREAHRAFVGRQETLDDCTCVVIRVT